LAPSFQASDAMAAASSKAQAGDGKGLMPRCACTTLELLSLTVAIASCASSMLYNYVYVYGQQAGYFNMIHKEYASPAMMNAFDSLEIFLERTGPERYAAEYMRLKHLAREVSANATVQRGLQQVAPGSDADVGLRLDSSRRRILHYFGKMLLFNREGYITERMLHEFPGRKRAAHALRLLQPLVQAGAQSFSLPPEHQAVLDFIQGIYGLSPADLKLGSASAQ